MGADRSGRPPILGNPDHPPEGGSLIERLQAGHPFPLIARFAITDRCNLSCGHCYARRARPRDEMSAGEILGALEELARLGSIRLALTGGEPAMRDDLVEIVEGARGMRYAVTLGSNATLLGDEGVDALARAGLGELHVGLQSHDAAAHDRFVGMAGAWERATRAMDRFLAAGGPVRASMIAMAWNADHVGSFLDLCSERGWIPGVDVRLGRRVEDGAEPEAPAASEEALLRALADPRLASELASDESFRWGPDEPLCSMGSASAYVMPDGEVWPCLTMPIPLGNLRETSFEEIWTGSRIREDLLAVRWGQSEACMSCDLRWACQRCPAQAYLEHGDVSAPASQDCFIARVRAAAARSWAARGDGGERRGRG